MSKPKSRLEGSSAAVPSKSPDGSSKTVAKPANASLGNLRDEIQARFKALDQKNSKQQKNKKSNKPNSSAKGEDKGKLDVEESGRGKKRDRNGQVLDRDEKGTAAQNAKTQQKKNEESDEEDD